MESVSTVDSVPLSLVAEKWKALGVVGETIAQVLRESGAQIFCPATVSISALEGSKVNEAEGYFPLQEHSVASLRSAYDGTLFIQDKRVFKRISIHGNEEREDSTELDLHDLDLTRLQENHPGCTFSATPKFGPIGRTFSRLGDCRIRGRDFSRLQQLLPQAKISAEPPTRGAFPNADIVEARTTSRSGASPIQVVATPKKTGFVAQTHLAIMGAALSEVARLSPDASSILTTSTHPKRPLQSPYQINASALARLIDEHRHSHPGLLDAKNPDGVRWGTSVDKMRQVIARSLRLSVEQGCSINDVIDLFEGDSMGSS